MRILLAVLVALGVHISAAHADDLGKTIDLALENYDLADYTAAKLQLEPALADPNSDPATVARGHLALGAVYLKLNNPEGAKAAFERALKADDSVTPEKRYADKELMALFEEVVAERKAATSCDGIAAISHQRGPQGKHGKSYDVSCLAGNQLGEVSVSVFYRTSPDAEYRRLDMNKTGECGWTAEVPKLSGEQLEYYFQATNKSGTTVAAQGSAASPIAVVIEAAPEPAPVHKRPEDEVPDELGGKPPKPRGNGCAGCSSAPASGASLCVVVVCALLAGRRRHRLTP